jgi:hypothetical protein
MLQNMPSLDAKRSKHSLQKLNIVIAPNAISDT